MANPIQTAITGALDKLMGTRSPQNMMLTASDTLKGQLSKNMLISGTVQAQLGDGKYSVKFLKESAVIESKTPLGINELLHGRVIGVGDKVELQRVFKDQAKADNQASRQTNWELLSSASSQGTRATEVLQSYRVSLSVDEQLNLATLLKGNIDSEAMTLSAVVLNKMGLRASTAALTTLYPVLSKTLNEKFNLQNLTAHLDFEPANGELTKKDTVKELASFLATVANEIPEAKLPSNKSEFLENLEHNIDHDNADLNSDDGKNNPDRQDMLFDARRLLLNSQSDGSVAHRVTVVPFVINDKLVEVDMALFSQRDQRQQPDSIQYKKIALSLDLDTLGKVDIEINMANKHARININTENNLITNEMVKFMPSLKNDFSDFNVKLDELSYGVFDRNKLGNVIGSVVEHYISQDSLNRVY